ncbi:MCE family protein [Nocardioides antri]|uniref:MCE family protein n=1 Tax=Nocardioides antri TaxID=2607659 RepID=A0A5B1M5Q8_9ACTN|nr:MCE family protein [Nocardioides antri]KAA1427818.1 MCE family protein [Nocardioides antri]
MTRAMLRDHRKPILGLVYLLVVGLLIVGSIAIYAKALPWQHATRVTVVAGRVGLELNPHSDVKLQGMRVGEVREISSDGKTATVELALDDDKLELIPANIDAAIVPKTLFGEKYVDLRVPDDPVSERLSEGGVIRQSRTSVEIGQLFARVVPLLRSLRPDQLSMVLGSLADAVDGRGAQIGRTLNQLSDYLTAMSPSLDTLGHDLHQLAKTVEVYADSAPEIVGLLESSAHISRDLLLGEQQQFEHFLRDLGAMSERAEGVLARNSERLVVLSGSARRILALLDEYAAALPCTISGLRTFETLMNQVVGTQGPYLNVRIEMEVNREPYRYPDDLPTNPGSDAHNSNLPPEVPSWAPHCPQFSAEVKSLRNPGLYSQPMYGGAPQHSSAEQDGSADARHSGASVNAMVADARDALSRAAAARLLNIPQESVPPYAGLIIGPMLSDGEVSAP